MRSLIILLISLPFLSFAGPADTVVVSHWDTELLKVRNLSDTSDVMFLNPEKVFSEKWDTLAHPNFWRNVMTLSPDSCLINIGKTREIITKMSIKDWDKQSDDEKDVYRDSIRKLKGLLATDKVYMTSGKNDFYSFDVVYPSLAKGVEVFHQEGVDPFYAQAILMIESPGKMKKSNVGAYGAFQLMKSVARSHGLRVDKYVDERKDFHKSAQGACSLLKNTCIPEAKRILNAKNITYSENDLWFRLFVLHIYHAGAGNVQAVINSIAPTEGGQQLIAKMWITSAGNFKNSSQNYSQLALASMIILNDLIYDKCDYIIADIN